VLAWRPLDLTCSAVLVSFISHIINRSPGGWLNRPANTLTEARLLEMRKFIFFLTLLMAVALALAACGGGSDTPADNNGGDTPAGDAAAGATLFISNCSSCHGPEGKGITGLGKDMTTSDFIAGLSDAELLEFVKTGRPISDPLNTTGVDMPPKGGNPALTDEQLLDIIAYIRTIHQ
jgi:mono/diheme cytochrome c family protein